MTVIARSNSARYWAATLLLRAEYQANAASSSAAASGWKETRSPVISKFGDQP